MEDGLRNGEIIKDGRGEMGQQRGGRVMGGRVWGGSPHWHTESLRTRSQLAIWKYAWGGAGREEAGGDKSEDS